MTSACVRRHTACSQATRAGEWYKKKKGEIRSARHPLEAPRVHQPVHKLFEHTVRQPPQEHEEASTRFVGHSNAGLCRMDTAGEMGAIKQMWLNEGRVATITPLKVLEKIWSIRYNFRCFDGSFVIHANQGNIIIKNTSKGMPYLDPRKLEAKVVRCPSCRLWCRSSIL